MIDKIRQSVLYILNKDNNGYITPEEFNKYADLAQMEIFLGYFSGYNDLVNKLKQGKVNSGVADLKENYAQSIDLFTSYVPLTQAVTPAQLIANIVSGVIIGVTIYSAGGGYPPSTTASVTITGTGTGASITYTTDSLGNVVSTTITSGGTGYTVAVLSITNPTTGINAYNLPSDWYFVNTVYYGNEKVERIERNILKQLQTSDKTAPTTTYPVYVMIENRLEVYPTTITSGLELEYIRYPKVPNWTYTTLSNGEASFDPTSATYQDFEVPEEENYSLVQKICQYCGVQIGQETVIQYMLLKDQASAQELKTI